MPTRRPAPHGPPTPTENARHAGRALGKLDVSAAPRLPHSDIVHPLVIRLLQLELPLFGALLGFIAGEIFVEDPAIAASMRAFGDSIGLAGHSLNTAAGVLGAAIVLAIGKWMLARKASQAHAKA